MVAGTAPWLRTTASTARAVSTLLREGHAVRDDGGLERHHGLTSGQRGGHLGEQVQRRSPPGSRHWQGSVWMQVGQARFCHRPPPRPGAAIIEPSQRLKGTPADFSVKSVGLVRIVW
jgi:hypothetical protein